MESVDTHRTRGKDWGTRGARVCGCAPRTSERASPFVLHAPAETNLSDKSWSYDRALSRAGKEIADARAPRPTAAPPRDSDRYHVNCVSSRLCTRGRRDATPFCTKDPCAATDVGFGAVGRTKRNKNREIRRKRRAHQTCNSDAPVVNYLAGGEQDRGEADDDVDKA
ncbi:hypothetical protein G5I_02181 [Acromyrmex echinatior]|uniref:Uncharacterized protein n=1 Tax=Acromyrmex echinatior TaxID=103372 RepID=F4W9M7_ACREC|nr:hypothetical protein G5I_02181 [Acromyrmex echinatior]